MTMVSLTEHVKEFIDLNERLREATAFAEAKFLTQFSDLSMIQTQVIRTIAFHKPCTMTQIAKSTQLSKGNITQLIDKLEHKGYVKRARSKDDRRVVFIVLTDRGQEVSAASRQQIAEVARSLFAKMNENERHQFMDVFRKLAN